MDKVNSYPDDVLRQVKGTMYEVLDFAIQMVQSQYVTAEQGSTLFIIILAAALTEFIQSHSEIVLDR